MCNYNHLYNTRVQKWSVHTVTIQCVHAYFLQNNKNTCTNGSVETAGAIKHTIKENNLILNNREIKHIIGDGNCLFRCLSQHLFNSQDKHQVVRELVCNFEKENASTFEVYLTPNQSQSIHEHVQLILKNNSWGTQVELIAAATYFQVPIYVYEYLPSSRSGKWTCVKPINNRKHLNCTTVTSIFDEQFNISSHFELYHTKDVHYDCIVSKDTGSVPIIPPTLDKTESYLDMKC